jgi:hypothetical protein
MIPLVSVTALANRFARGERLKGKGAWSAVSASQAPLADVEFVVNRLSHAIKHCYEAIARLKGTLPPLDGQDAEDGGDAGAIMFAGALLAAHLDKKAMTQK